MRLGKTTYRQFLSMVKNPNLITENYYLMPKYRLGDHDFNT